MQPDGGRQLGCVSRVSDSGSTAWRGATWKIPNQQVVTSYQNCDSRWSEKASIHFNQREKLAGGNQTSASAPVKNTLWANDGIDRGPIGDRVE